MFGAIIQQIVLGISLAAPVGPINIEMLKRGIERGFWHAWVVGIGGMTADVFYASHLFRFIFCVYVYICTSLHVLHGFSCYFFRFQSVKQGIFDSNMEYKKRGRWP